MKILTHEEISSLKTKPEDYYKWAVDMIISKKNVYLPAKTSMRPTDDIFYTTMPSLIPSSNVAGVKMVSRYPKRIPSLDSQIMLYDYPSGNLKALLDGNLITTMRTGAVAAHSIKLLADKNFEKIGIIGLGNQAMATFKILLGLYPNRKMKFKIFKYKNQHINFQRYIKSLPYSSNIEFELCDTYEATVIDSDIVVSSVTYFDEDICSDSCFKEGCLVVPIHTRGFMNCDLFFDKVFADDIGHVTNFKHFKKFKSFGEISSVVNNKIFGRTSNKERIIVYNIGLSMHDIYFAEKIYQLSEIEKLGIEVSLEPPKDKFWV